MLKLDKGDLVEYVSPYSGKKGVGVIMGTDKDWWVIKGYVSIKNHIVKKTVVKKIIKKCLVPKIAFKAF